MDKQKLQPLKGFRDFLPEEARKRQFLVDKLKDTFELFGFEPLETPALEYQELLLGKYGEEGDKLMYTFEDKGGRAVALRYDQTVPTARIIASYQNNLTMPFKRYQMQPVWRADKPQAGRYRELLQCDIDIFGTTSPVADAEIVALINNAYSSLGFKNFKIYINDRQILYELMKFASIPEEKQLPTIAAIDKLDRKTQDEVGDDLKNIGLTDEDIEHLFHHLDEQQPNERLAQVIDNAKNLGVPSDKIVFQARLARGLDYYTSTIFEVKIAEYKHGSVGGGGRYDKLIEKLAGVVVPAVGFAFGFDRTLEAMDELNLFEEQKQRRSTLVTIFNEELLKESQSIVNDLRQNGISTELFPDESKDLKKQLKYADKKNIKWLIVIGPDEIKNETVVLKDLETGHQEDVPQKKLIDKLK